MAALAAPTSISDCPRQRPTARTAAINAKSGTALARPLTAQNVSTPIANKYHASMNQTASESFSSPAARTRETTARQKTTAMPTADVSRARRTVWSIHAISTKIR